MNKYFILMVTQIICGAAYSANFQTYQSNGRTGIECLMNAADSAQLYTDIDLEHAVQPRYLAVKIFLKDAVPGTRVLVSGNSETIAEPALTINGYQGFHLPQDEYELTLKRPDGTELTFPFLRFADSPCVLQWDEVAAAVGK